MERILVTYLFTLLLLGCDSGGRIENTKELSREIKASQIKRVTNTQLIYSADEWGKKIAQIADKSLRKEIAGSPEKAKTFCRDLAQIPVIAALQKEYGVKVSLIGAADLKNPDLAAKEREILDAYMYSSKQKAAAGDNLQQVSDSLLVYNAPIPADSPICKTCMSGPDSTFAVWRLVFSKKDIIRKLDAKQLNK